MYFKLSDIEVDWKNWTYKFDGIEAHIARIQDKKERLDTHRPIPSYAVQSIKESLTMEWIFNSNSIEGNTLTLQETKLVLEEGITIKGKSLREHFEAVNHQDAIEYIETLADPSYVLNSSDILEVHALVLQKIEKEFAGRFRTSGVRISGANFTPPNALKIVDLIDELVEWTNTTKSIHICVLSAIFHHRFVWIHPFFDGNGRTARLLFNLLLMKEGYPPAIILKNDRKKYYDALNKANKGDYGKLVLLVLQAVERSLDIYLGHLENNYDDYQLISNIVEESDIPYGQEYVSLLARQGKIDAFKEGRNWLTTRHAVLDYARNKGKVNT